MLYLHSELTQHYMINCIVYFMHTAGEDNVVDSLDSATNSTSESPAQGDKSYIAGMHDIQVYVHQS